MSRSRSRIQKVVPETPDSGPRGCAYPDCAAEGSFRAPRSRTELDQHIWLCLDHIREYNKTWDYFAGMSQAEIEAHVRRDIIGWRPTWPLGRLSANTPEAAQKTKDGAQTGAKGRQNRGSGPHWSGAKPGGDPFAHIRDDFGLFGEARRPRRDRAEAGAGFQRRYRARDEETQALDTLGLSQPLSLAALKARYKELVKRFHPDANGGDKAAEERLKLVNQAYATLKNSVSLP
jgi:hypothetical protein